MRRFNKLVGLIVILGLALLTSISAHAEEKADNDYRDFSKMTPSATLEFETKSLKLLIGGSWGTGTLNYQGKSYPLKVAAMSVGGVGYRTIKGTGKVYELKSLEDFEGNYSSGTAGATIGTAGGGVATLENGKGVVIAADVTDSAGAQLSIGVSGIEIEFEK